MSDEIDVQALSRMIQAKRGKLGLRAAAEEIGGVSASTLSRVEAGKLPDLDTYFRICNWLGVPADHFSVTNKVDSTKNVVVAHLRADRALDPATTEALVKMIQIAYDAIDQEKIGKRKKGQDAARIQNVG